MDFWKNKIAVVTGGSKGLGREIARALAAVGARVILVARDDVALRVAADEIRASTGQTVDVRSADVTDPQAAANIMQTVLSEYGGIDVLVNVVGASLRTKLVDTRPETFREQMAINFESAVNCTQAALKSLIARRGRIVNVASLAAKTPWPLVGPYVTSKAALAAYTNQLRFEIPELGGVLLVCPGPIRRADSGVRYRDSAATLGEEAQTPGAGVKLSGLAPDELARRILKASAAGTRELILPGKARWLFFVDAFSPGLGDWLRRRFNRHR